MRAWDNYLSHSWHSRHRKEPPGPVPEQRELSGAESSGFVYIPLNTPMTNKGLQLIQILLGLLLMGVGEMVASREHLEDIRSLVDTRGETRMRRVDLRMLA